MITIVETVQRSRRGTQGEGTKVSRAVITGTIESVEYVSSRGESHIYTIDGTPCRMAWVPNRTFTNPGSSIPACVPNTPFEVGQVVTAHANSENPLNGIYNLDKLVES